MTETLEKLPLGDIETLTGSLAQRVYAVLREAILHMRCPPGTVLRKGQICEQLGVSRSPVAEAIAKLSAEGLVDVVPQSATRVSRFSMSVIREATFLREALELAAVERVAQTITEEQLVALTRNLKLQRLLVEDGDHAGFFEADEDFHNMIMAFTGYQGVTRTLAGVSLQLSRARILLLPSSDRAQESLREHEEVLEALRRRDAETARSAMRFHLGQLISRIEPLEHVHSDFFVAQ